MSVYHLNQIVRRTALGSSSVCSQICKAATTSNNLIPSNSSNQYTTNSSTRTFAAAAASNKKAKNTNNNNTPSYQDRKDIAKEKRRQTYNTKQLRLQNLKTRRDASPKDVLKNKFRNWYDNELQYHNKLIRSAKKENKPWKIRVAVMVERIPVVTPDMEEWERNYINLRDYIWTYGKEYPEETGFMYDMDSDEDHIVPSDEELLGKFLVIVCVMCVVSKLTIHPSCITIHHHTQLVCHSHQHHVKLKQMPREMLKHVTDN